jgi:hypothetical protein
MNVTDSQKSEILAHLKAGESLTARECSRLFDCDRLAARIKEIRDDGHAVDMTWETDGTKRWGRYSLAPPKPLPTAADGQGMLL